MSRAGPAPGGSRVGWPCECGCGEVVPPQSGKGGGPPRRFASAACSNRYRVRMHLRAKRKAAKACGRCPTCGQKVERAT